MGGSNYFKRLQLVQNHGTWSDDNRRTLVQYIRGVVLLKRTVTNQEIAKLIKNEEKKK